MENPTCTKEFNFEFIVPISLNSVVCVAKILSYAFKLLLFLVLWYL